MGNKVVPLALQMSWQPDSHKRERQQGHILLRARAQHEGSRQWTCPANDYSRLIIAGPISPKYRNGNLQTVQIESPSPLQTKKKYFSSNHSALTQEHPTHPKFPSPAGWFPKRQSWKIPCICQYTGVSKSRWSWLWRMHPDTSGVQYTRSQHTASCCMALCKITGHLSYCSSETDPMPRWGTAQKPPVSFWLGSHKWKYCLIPLRI